MGVVFLGIMSHAPGLTGRLGQAPAADREAVLEGFAQMRARLEASRPDLLVVVAAEHFSNFFMNNMPAYALGMADRYEGPIEDEQWLRIPRTVVPGNAAASRAILQHLIPEVDLAYCEEWKFDHGIMVPLHYLTPHYDIPIVPVNINCQQPPFTPLARAWAFGRALRRACDALPQRVALLGTGGISHWPGSTQMGRINEDFDREFLRRWTCNDRDALVSYADEEVLREAGHGGIEIRTLVAIAAAAGGGSPGELLFYHGTPAFSIGSCAAVMPVLPTAPARAFSLEGGHVAVPGPEAPV